MKRILLCLLIMYSHFSALQGDHVAFSSSSFQNVPVSYQGRFRDYSGYTSLWWSELYGSSSIREKDRPALAAKSAEEAILKLHLYGHSQWDDTPLFYIKSSQLKDFLGLAKKTDRFSFSAVKKSLDAIPPTSAPPKKIDSDLALLRQLLYVFESQTVGPPPSESAFAAKITEWRAQGLEAKKIAELAHEKMPLRMRLLKAGESLKVLPSRREPGEWYSLKALYAQNYDQQTGETRLASNFTTYSDTLFEEIRQAYFSLSDAALSQNSSQAQQQADRLGSLLRKGYSTIAGTPIFRSQTKTLEYPTNQQLRAEGFYYRTPLIAICLAFYGIALCCLLLNIAINSPRLQFIAISLLITGFVVHTVVIGLRCYILGRPPVSNMFETVIYVPWIAVLLSFILNYFLKAPIVFIGSSLTAIVLLVLLKVTNLSGNMENVQAVLDSQYWLTIHVMMIVGSYGVFALSAILSHFYIADILSSGLESPSLKYLSRCILQTLYIGVALLIPGTILGGVWAAQSWGRFWDWDPKESWAFISSCAYLASIHAYRFGYIGNFGLAIGSILGFMTISFTWYGVNYLLGTGLHSYGFGTGGNGFYYAFLLVEAGFAGVGSCIFFLQKKERINY